MTTTITPSLPRRRQQPLPSQACYALFFTHPQVEALIQILIHHLDLDTLQELYNDLTYQYFENPAVLSVLARRHGLAPAATFDALLYHYDLHYATTRSYHRSYPAPTGQLVRRPPLEVYQQACQQGNIAAVVYGLRHFPVLLEDEDLDFGVQAAVFGGHQSIVELMLEIDRPLLEPLLVAACAGGHLELIELLLDRGADITGDCYCEAAAHNHLAVIDRLDRHPTANRSDRRAIHRRNTLMFGAGQSGNSSTIAAVEQRLNDFGEFGEYVSCYLLNGAASRGHLTLVEQLMTAHDFNDDQLEHALIAAVVGRTTNQPSDPVPWSLPPVESHDRLAAVKYLLDCQLRPPSFPLVTALVYCDDFKVIDLVLTTTGLSCAEVLITTALEAQETTFRYLMLRLNPQVAADITGVERSIGHLTAIMTHSYSGGRWDTYHRELVTALDWFETHHQPRALRKVIGDQLQLLHQSVRGDSSFISQLMGLYRRYLTRIEAMITASNVAGHHVASHHVAGHHVADRRLEAFSSSDDSDDGST